MDLWIRTQNKTFLRKVDNIYIDDVDKDVFVVSCDRRFALGFYKTKERALEVLDEIQSFISNDGMSFKRNDNGMTKIICLCPNVYEMPKE